MTTQFVTRTMRRLVFMTICNVWYRSVWCSLGEFAVCHEDYILKLADGILERNTFSWLGFVKYIHITTGLSHHTKAPRVILIHKHFVLGTATDMLLLPNHYKLGNVVFGDYDRDEIDCNMTRSQLKLGVKCAPAYIEVPIIDITPHPEYSRFGVGNSLALVKMMRPMQSFYMVPVCMATLSERHKMYKNRQVFMVDYVSSVPQDLVEEKMAKRTLRLYTHDECSRHRRKSNIGSEHVTHMLCTTGCGVRSGAPIIRHNKEGAFELIGIAAGSGFCSHKSMRENLIKEPPLYIDVYPYVTWIINVIKAHELPSVFPQDFRRVDGGSSLALRKDILRQKKRTEGWKGRVYMSGVNCFYKPKHEIMAFFYMETFKLSAPLRTGLNVKIQSQLDCFEMISFPSHKISAGEGCTILCARMHMPSRLSKPLIKGVGQSSLNISFSADWYPYIFDYTLVISGKNSTKDDLD